MKNQQSKEVEQEYFEHTYWQGCFFDSLDNQKYADMVMEAINPMKEKIQSLKDELKGNIKLIDELRTSLNSTQTSSNHYQNIIKKQQFQIKEKDEILDGWKQANRRLADEIDLLESQIKELKGYTVHKSICDLVQTVPASVGRVQKGDKCTCGLEQLLNNKG